MSSQGKADLVSHQITTSIDWHKYVVVKSKVDDTRLQVYSRALTAKQLNVKFPIAQCYWTYLLPKPLLWFSNVVFINRIFKNQKLRDKIDVMITKYKFAQFILDNLFQINNWTCLICFIVRRRKHKNREKDLLRIMQIPDCAISL